MSHTVTHTALQPLKEKFSGVKFGVAEFRGQVTVVVPAASIVEVCRFLHNDPRLKFDMLADLSATDYLDFPGGTPGRFAVNYLLSSIDRNERLFLKVFLDPQWPTEPGSKHLAAKDEDVLEQGDPGLRLASVTSVWPGAEWMEREAYDLMGIVFTDHPDLRRIMTWNGFGNHPLRKDYPLRGVGEREDYKIVTRDSA